MSVVIAHDKAGGQFLDSPRRREAAGGQIFRSSVLTGAALSRSAGRGLNQFRNVENPILWRFAPLVQYVQFATAKKHSSFWDNWPPVGPT
jgi:hypothetical protein